MNDTVLIMYTWHSTSRVSGKASRCLAPPGPGEGRHDTVVGNLRARAASVRVIVHVPG
jgi:hypothetical protein